MNTVMTNTPELQILCSNVRNLIGKKNYEECFAVICKSMEAYPDAPQPHNLLGILFERQGKHPLAMRHFRAAYALDPGYAPARMNLDSYGTFFSGGRSVYGDEEAFCPENAGQRVNRGMQTVGRKENEVI